jgi:glycosyltransferase involved in cell wall biosynthesis
MKKICHITSTPQNAIPRLLRESSTAIKIGIKPYIVAQGDSFEKEGITYIGIRTARNRFERILFTSRLLINEALKIDADIYQIHDPELLPFASKLKKKGKKVIFDSHEFYGLQIEVKEYIPRILRKTISSIYKRYEAFICKRIDAVVAVCTINGKDYFENRTKKTVFLANMPDIDVFFQGAQRIEEVGPKKVVYVGTMSESRGITNLIKSVGKTKAKLTLCGSFPSEEYFRRIREFKEYNKVDYLGVVPRNEIVEILNDSYIGISTLLHVGQYSEIDTLPTKVYEYMALGLPIIISDTNYARKLIKEYEFGICVDPGSIDELADKIDYLIDNPHIAKKMGEVGKRLAREKFNWSIEEMKISNLYTELINK